MQIPLSESLITFLCANVLERSTDATNLLSGLVLFDADENASAVFGTPRAALERGLVAMPPILQFKAPSPRDASLLANGAFLPSPVHTRFARAVAEGTDRATDGLCDAQRNLVDRYRASGYSVAIEAIAARLRGEDPAWCVGWISPTVPPGALVLWHGWHTTRGSASTATKSTIFLDYAPAEAFGGSDAYLDHYQKRYEDLGSGNAATRGSGSTSEYVALRGLPPAPLASGEIEGLFLLGTDPEMMAAYNDAMGSDDELLARVRNRGFAIVDLTDPLLGLSGEASEVAEVLALVEATRVEMEDFLTFSLLEREFRFLTAWLVRFADDVALPPPVASALRGALRHLAESPRLIPSQAYGGAPPLLAHADIATARTAILSLGANVRPLAERADYRMATVDGSVTRRPAAENARVWYSAHLHEWVELAVNTFTLDLRAPAAEDGEQDLLWGAVHPRPAMPPRLHHPLVFYRRKGLGYAPPGVDFHAWLDGRLREEDVTMYSFYHESTAQGGGRAIASDSGMGQATTYLGGEAHLALQLHPALLALARKLYGCDCALPVPERFRTKRTQGWGKAHVDHSPVDGLVVAGIGGRSGPSATS
jgi:hypothetical protein